MPKINFSDTKFLSLILLGICLLSISENFPFSNKVPKKPKTVPENKATPSSFINNSSKFTSKYKLGQVLKINIEGAEYNLMKYLYKNTK